MKVDWKIPFFLFIALGISLAMNSIQCANVSKEREMYIRNIKADSLLMAEYNQEINNYIIELAKERDNYKRLETAYNSIKLKPTSTLGMSDEVLAKTIREMIKQ